MDPAFNQPRPTIDQLRHVAKNYPIIDNHAHNLILPAKADTIPFETITSEAQGRALRDTFKALSHLRAAKQLRQLYECGEDADWEDILEQRTEWLRSDPERLHNRCFEGVHALLIDDGLAGPDKVYPFTYHDRFTKAPSKRIVRIETVAERLMEDIIRDANEDDLRETKFLPDTWLTFTDDFERKIQEAIKDPDVVGFKTVVCYRTGLDVEPDYEQAARAVGHPFERYVKNCIRKRSYRIEKRALNNYLVLRTLEILSERLPHSDSVSKPLQFHTGLGDNDISLLESNPAYLQPLIENYPTVPFVLLHSSYPYTREAGYLATVYRHVYLDIGEVFPMVSRDGQKAILRQAMELVPGSKLLYSSDGHWFPETFWLANLQFREVWLELLIEYVQKGDLTPHQAIAMTKDILFNNSNTLYDLRYHVIFDETVEEIPKQLTYNIKSDPTSPYLAPSGPPPHTQTPGLATRAATMPIPAVTSPIPLSPSFPPPPRVPQVYDVQLFDQFTEKNPDVKFIYVQWIDYMATTRARIIPIKEFSRLIREGERIGISQGNTGTLQNDTVTPVVNTTGQIYIEPDLRSLRRTHQKDPLPAATVLSYWRDASGNALRECPRNNLEVLINQLQYTYSSTLLVGFEIEVVFLSRNTNSTHTTSPTSSSSSSPSSSQQTQQRLPNTEIDPYTPLTRTHAWGTLTPEQWLALPFLSEIVLALEAMGIDVQQFHAESGPGQYEFILAPLPPLLAVDTLLQARQAIAQIAALHGLRATLHPKPLDGVGTAAHAHVSLHPPGRDRDFFVAGVLRHLRALCAFCLPSEASYARVVDNAWSGGTWVAWGTQNRETPLRRVGDGRWEVRCWDGMANVYFALAGVLAAGMLGLAASASASASGLQSQIHSHSQDQSQPQVHGDAEEPHPLHPPPPTDPCPEKDTPVNPSTLDDQGRQHYGIAQRMPASIEESLDALQRDGELNEALPQGLVRDYVSMKEAEGRMLAGMSERERRVFLIERY